MPGRILAIASNTYREAVRARILLGLVGLAVATAIYALAVGEFTLRNVTRVIANIGAASISAYALAVAVVMGATSLYRELEMKTIFPILARPIHRAEYLVGKFLGTVFTLAVFIAVDAGLVLYMLAAHAEEAAPRVFGIVLGFVAVLGLALWRLPRWRTHAPIPWSIAFLAVACVVAADAPDDRRVVLASSALALLEVMIVCGIATVFSSFSSPFLTAVLTLGVFIVGRSADTLERLPERQFGVVIKRVGQVVAKLLPNLQIYVPARPLLTGEAPDVNLSTHLLSATAYALSWCAVLLVLAHFIFRKRDFL